MDGRLVGVQMACAIQSAVTDGVSMMVRRINTTLVDLDLLAYILLNNTSITAAGTYANGTSIWVPQNFPCPKGQILYLVGGVSTGAASCAFIIQFEPD